MSNMNRFSLSAVLIMAFFASGCLEFASVTQPGTAESLETFQVPITINLVDARDDGYWEGAMLAIKLPNNWSVMDSIEFRGDYSVALVPDPSVSTLFEESRPSGPDHTWWGGSSGVGFAPVAGTSVSGTADIIINDTTGTFSIDYYAMGLNGTGSVEGRSEQEVAEQDDRHTGLMDSSVAHSITVIEIPTAVHETTWGVLKSRR